MVRAVHSLRRDGSRAKWDPRSAASRRLGEEENKSRPDELFGTVPVPPGRAGAGRGSSTACGRAMLCRERRVPFIAQCGAARH